MRETCVSFGVTMAFGIVTTKICKERAKFIKIDRDIKQILSYISE